MKINPEYINYAKKMSDLGDRIISISNQFSDKPMESAEKVKYQYDTSLKTISEYKECKSDLEKVVPPNIVKKEHEEMISAIQMFIDGTENMFKAVDIDSRIVNTEMTLAGFSLQQQGKNLVVNIAKRIGDKFEFGE